MLYYLFRAIFRITIQVFFKSLQVKGAEHIPSKGPVFLVANHPSGFMDPIVIAALVKRPLHFLAKGALFQSKFAKWILPKFNVIPIYRSEETPGQGHKNKDIFRKCYQHLEQGGALLIFPEGISLTERKIKKIQSGTARICFGAEAENDFKLGIQIVTVGLNFSNPHKFQSDLFVNIDSPIFVADYQEIYKQDTFKAAHVLSDEIRKRLEKQVIAIEDKDVDQLVANIELIHKSQLLRDMGYAENEMEADFKATKVISDTVHFFKEHQPERVERLKKEIDSYLDNLERLSLNDQTIRGVKNSSPILNTIKSLLYLVVGFPLFVFGVINNYLPFRIPYWSFNSITKRPEFFGSISISIGTLAFIVFYTLQIWLVAQFASHWIYIILYIILLPTSGFFAFYYHRKFTNIRGSWIVLSLFYKKTNLITSLLAQREYIINQLEKGKKEFLERGA